MESDHDLLIGIKTTLTSVLARLDKIEKKQSCDTNREKIKILEKITWTALGAAMIAGIKSFWPGP